MEQSAVKAINRRVTIRNWLIGFYIIEFEQKGANRAAYGDRLLELLAEKLATNGLSFRNLKLFRQFYLGYPQIGQTVSAQLQTFGLQALPINYLLGSNDSLYNSSVSSDTIFADANPDVNTLISKLSFSHFTLLLPLRSAESRAL